MIFNDFPTFSYNFKFDLDFIHFAALPMGDLFLSDHKLSVDNFL